jgi:hypothetical protein
MCSFFLFFFDAFYCTTNVQILGADILQTKDPYKTFELLKSHINAVRMCFTEFVMSPVHIIVERNLGFEAEHVYRECRDSVEHCNFICEPGVDRIGVLTTHTRKLAYVSVMNIMLREDRIFAVDDSLWIDIGKNNTRSMLMDQLSFFGFLFSRPENAFQKEKVAINGKSAGGKDDICMAMLIGIFFVHESKFLLR